MSSKSHVIYTGITNDLGRRVFEHKTGRIQGFTQKYRVRRLVYFESWKYVRSAITREKEIKHWTRQRRVDLIESINPTWEDLAASWFTAEQLAADPSAPIKMSYDPTKVRSFGGKPHSWG
jgi:putative endonuclease